jgi:predicted alpha/beta hydrolase family esterase
LGSSPEENWFPWLANELRKRGCEVTIPRFPTPEGQSLASWQAAFEAQVGEVTPDMVLVGHSLGPAFIVRLLEAAPRPAAATFMVAPFLGSLENPEFDGLNKSFFFSAVDWKSVKKNAGFVRIYSSDNDPYVPIAKGLEFAQKMDSELTVMPQAGHFNMAAGYDTFPKLLQEIPEFLAK